MSEAFSFVRKFDVPPQILYVVMTEGLLAAPVYRVYGKIIVDDRYDQAGFTVQLALKDAELMAAAADSVHVPLPSGALLRDRLREAITQGNGEKDWAILARVQARLSGLDEGD
jgi:3-hydroxyisobutyrate dehydrogenase-like beta-hydroxyacid dehydrogenase